MREYLNPRNTKEYRQRQVNVATPWAIEWYWSDKPEIKTKLPEELRELFDDYTKKCDECQNQGYYIKGNSLYFTYKSEKYKCRIYYRECVERFVEEIARKLAVRGCSKMCYVYGELD